MWSMTPSSSLWLLWEAQGGNCWDSKPVGFFRTGMMTEALTHSGMNTWGTPPIKNVPKGYTCRVVLILSCTVWDRGEKDCCRHNFLSWAIWPERSNTWSMSWCLISPQAELPGSCLIFFSTKHPQQCSCIVLFYHSAMVSVKVPLRSLCRWRLINVNCWISKFQTKQWGTFKEQRKGSNSCFMVTLFPNAISLKVKSEWQHPQIIGRNYWCEGGSGNTVRPMVHFYWYGSDVVSPYYNLFI